MGNTYTALHCHVVFRTKHREPWLTDSIQARVWSYLGGIAQANGIKPLQIGGVDDHVHLLIGLSSTLALSQTMQRLKGGSSAWIKDTFPDLRGFGCQDGYAAFAVSQPLTG